VVVGMSVGLSWRSTLLVGVSTAVIIGVVVQGASRLERQIRNSADSAMVSVVLGPSPPGLGTWAIEADFGQLIVHELAAKPEVVVECGSGITTLIIASYLRTNGAGRLYSLEHDPWYASQTARRLEAAGLSSWVEVIVAPLVDQHIGPIASTWYDQDVIGERLPSHVELLVVDGPPSTNDWARWPAVEVLHSRLAVGAVVLLDDGRQRREQRIAFRWQSDHPDLQLFWHDTVKGSWKLVKVAEPPNDGRRARACRYIVRRLHPRPSGFGRWPIRR